MADRPVVGQVVKSVSGRDQGRLAVVINVIDDKFVEVVDGDLRPVERPKKKNVRHLEVLDLVLTGIKHKVANGVALANDELLRELAGLRD